MAKVARAEYDKQLAQLRAWCPPGSTVYTILEHVSRSGMQRTIKVVVPYTRHRCDECGHEKPEDRRVGSACRRDAVGVVLKCLGRYTRAEVDHLHPNYTVSTVTGYALDKGRGRDGIKIGGCGMDMGFALVHSLSERLWGGQRCDCGRWRSYAGGDLPQGERGQAAYWALAVADREQYRYTYLSDCPKCAGTGNVIGTGYQCLGKGKCPSNYHSNHRDRVRCEGTRVYNPDGPDTGKHCYKPGGAFSRHPVPEGWPMRQIPIGDGQTIDLPAACITDEHDENPVICPTCAGVGDLPNPDGPERFDLEHFDGYALRHRWL